MPRRFGTSLALSALAVATQAFATSDGGLAALQARLGSNTPTGNGIGVMQVEAPMTSGGSDFAPDVTNSEFIGKSIVVMNTPLSAGWHATNVAMRLYGAQTSMAHGISNAWVYNTSNWVNDNLNVGKGSTAPTTLPHAGIRVMNHSWLSTYGSAAPDREAVRRIDYQMTRDGVLAVCGENNGAGSTRYPLMGDCFNGISVGRTDLQHSAGDTAAASDAPGRMKPELIAPGQFTSFSAPTVGAAASLLFETFQSTSSSGITNAQKCQAVKACLLGGADRDASWANNAPASGTNRGVATKPLDALRGSGELNVDQSHLMLTSERVDGATTIAATAEAASTGWGTATLLPSGKGYWRFRLYQPAASLAFTVVWPRTVVSSFTSYTSANMNLRMQRALNGATQLRPLEGDGGLATFGSGNVSSNSAVDNVETIQLRDLQPGEYIVELSRSDSIGANFTGYAAWSIDPAAIGIAGDVDGSGSVDYGDVALVVLSFGDDEPIADIDANGTVDYGDIALVLLNFG